MATLEEILKLDSLSQVSNSKKPDVVAHNPNLSLNNVPGFD